MYSKIIISGDLLRTKQVGESYENFHLRRINKYFDFLKYQLSKSTKCKIEKLNTDNTDIDPHYMYELCGLAYGGDEEWLKIYDYDGSIEDLCSYYNQYIDDSLVIYIEMPLIYKKIHNQLNIPYVDLTVHPIRFLDDNFWGISTNCPAVFDRMKQYQIDDNKFYIQANYIKAIADFNPLKIEKNSAVIIGQTNVDKALYHNGRCLSIMDYEEQIKQLGDKYSIIYYKSHPFNHDLGKIHKFLSQFPFVELCPSDWNTYEMLAHPNLQAVYSITSGVLYEAPYFGKDAYCLHKLCFNFNYHKDCEYNEDLYLSIYGYFAYPNFWADVLSEVVETKKISDDVKIENIPNRIRAIFNDYWSYTKLDPSVITISKQYNDRIRTLTNKVQELEHQYAKSNFNPDHFEINTTLNDKIALLQDQLEVLKNEPCFEKNFFKRVGKRVAFSLSKKSTYFNAIFVLMKLKKEAQKYIEKGNSITSIKGITYRPHAPHAGRGGGGAVLSAMQAILGNRVGNYDITYNYSERDGIWHTLKNRYFTYRNYERLINKHSHLIPLYAAIAFVFEKTKYEKDKLYVCHDYATAYGLALLKKKYILVIHSQGTRVDEKITLGEPMTMHERKVIMSCEKVAIENALVVSFPSKGAEKSYFSSKYCLVNIVKSNIAQPLYNTVYYTPKLSKISNLVDKKDTITFASIGTITEAKGQDRVCEFFDHFLAVHNQQKIRWICIGKGPKQDVIEQKINELERKYPNFECVRYDKLNFAQVQYVLSISQIYIMLQRTAIFDLSILEAMNRNCALILSEVGGNIEFNVCNNVLFSTEKADLKYEITNKAVLTNLRDLNKKAYEIKFSNRHFKEEYEKIIISVVEQYNSLSK